MIQTDGFFACIGSDIINLNDNLEFFVDSPTILTFESDGKVIWAEIEMEDDIIEMDKAEIIEYLTSHLFTQRKTGFENPAYIVGEYKIQKNQISITFPCPDGFVARLNGILKKDSLDIHAKYIIGEFWELYEFIKYDSYVG